MRPVVCGPALGLPPYAVVSWLDANDAVSSDNRGDSRRDRRDMIFGNRGLFGRLLRGFAMRGLPRQHRPHPPPDERESR